MSFLLMVCLCIMALLAGALYTRAPMTRRNLCIMGGGVLLIVLVVLNPASCIHLTQSVLHTVLSHVPHF
jgi:hypothetical protein